MKENFNSSSSSTSLPVSDNTHNDIINYNAKIVCPLCDEDISDLKDKINIHLEECLALMKNVIRQRQSFMLISF